MTFGKKTESAAPIDFTKPLVCTIGKRAGAVLRYKGVDSTATDKYKHLILGDGFFYLADDCGNVKYESGATMRAVRNPPEPKAKVEKAATEKTEAPDGDDVGPRFKSALISTQKKVYNIAADIDTMRDEIRSLNESFLLFADEVRGLIAGKPNLEADKAVVDKWVAQPPVAKEPTPTLPTPTPEKEKPRAIVRSFEDIKTVEISGRAQAELSKLDGSKVLRDRVRSMMQHPAVTAIVVGTKNWARKNGNEGDIVYYADRTPMCVKMRGQDADGTVDLYVNFKAGAKAEVLKFVENLK